MPKPGPRTTYKYTDKFKATAVKLSELSGVASKDVAESNGEKKLLQSK